MREFFSRFILSIVFLTAIFAITNSVYADCEATPDVPPPPQPTAGDCTAVTEPGTQERKLCCANLYPLNSTDPSGHNPEMARYLCERREKMNPEDAKKLHESFTQPGPNATSQTDRTPIIFLPGIAGSILNSDGRQLWPLAPGGDRADMALKPDGRTSATGAKIEVGDVLRPSIPGLDFMNFYGDFLNMLVALGYQENLDLYTFPYDWRCSNNSHFRALDNKINQALQATGKQKVILIAHSMGGLIARGYLYSDGTRAAKVDRLITMGTPYWGAVKPYYALVNGYTFGNGSVNNKLMKVLVQNYPAAYQVQPRIPFVEDSSSKQKLQLTETNTIRYKWFTKHSYGIPDIYEDTSTNETGLNTDLVKMAEDFYSQVGAKENPRSLPPGVKQYVIIGRNISTLGGYELKEWSSGALEWFFPGFASAPRYVEIKGKPVVLRPVSTDGDGTVPIWSAETSAATKTYYVSYDKESSEHSSLPKNQEVQYIVARIIKNSPPDEADFPKPQTNPEKELENLAEFLLHSDAHLHITDSSGRILGYNRQGLIEEKLPGTFLDMDGTEYASVAQLDGRFRVEIVGIREGKFTLDVNVKNKGKIERFSYKEVPVKNGTVASLTITPAQVPPPPEMTVTTDGQITRVSPTVGPVTSPSESTNTSIPNETTDFSRELNTTFTGNTPTLRYYALNDAFPDKCQADCAKDPACAAYTYVKPGGYKAGDPPVCYLFSGLGPKVASDCCISGARNSQAPPRVSKACGYSMTEAIYKKWTELGSGEGKLGCPISGETECGPSVKNTTCRLIQFKKDDGGYLLQHTSGPLSGKVFDVSGCMFKLYYELNGPKSWLGLPTSDGYVTSAGSREDFENGYILWDSKTWACTAHNIGTPPPPQAQADVATPPQPKVPAKVPGMWQLISMEQHGNLDRAPARAGDGDMVIQDAKFDQNGGEFTVRIAMADLICAQREQDTLYVKWRFNSDIRLLAPGAAVPLTVEVRPGPTGKHCPYFALARSEFVLVWSDNTMTNLFPESEWSKYWGNFSHAQGAPNRRFNYYYSDDHSTTTGNTAFELTTNLPGPNDPKRGWFGFVLHTNGCCGPPPNPKRGMHGFWYVYEFAGK